MNLLNDINIITIAIAGIVIIPIITGIINPLSRHRMQHSLLSMVNNLEIIIGILLTSYLFRVILYDNDNRVLTSLYKLIPSAADLVARYEHNLIANVIFLGILFSVVLFLIRCVTAPVFKFVLIPLTSRFSAAVDSLGSGLKRIISGIWQLPKSIWMVLVFSLILNLYISVGNNAVYKQYINQSPAYQKINEKALTPLLGSDIAQKIPVLINDSFRQINENLATEGSGLPSAPNLGFGGSGESVIEYFNGVTLDEAIQSNDKIDQTAKKIIGSEKDDKKKAYLIYQWICKNIDYDYDKAEKIVSDPTVVTSGSEVAYDEKKGVCFDYATLYVSMCRAVDLKVRLVTGLGYSGTVWGDHAWNQVYYEKEDRWINVDTTFGSAGYDFFDESDFSSYHKYADIQGEW